MLAFRVMHDAHPRSQYYITDGTQNPERNDITAQAEPRIHRHVPCGFSSPIQVFSVRSLRFGNLLNVNEILQAPRKRRILC